MCGTDNSGSTSQWVTSGSGIAYSGGEVGIGITPSYSLYKDELGYTHKSRLSVDYSDIAVYATSNWAIVADGTYRGVIANGRDNGVVASALYTAISATSSGTSTGTFGAMGLDAWSHNIGVKASGGTYDFYAVGSGTDYGTSSSIRWKNNVTLIDDALDKVLKLEGVYYDWNEEHGGLHDMGFIAEDVGVVVPEVVGFEDKNNASNWYTDDEGNKKLYATGVDYGALTPMLVEAIKEQQEEIDSQQEKLDKICSKLPSLCE